MVETEHEVADEGEEERLRQVVGHLDQALRGREGQLAVHPRRPLPVHHLRSRLARSGRNLVPEARRALAERSTTLAHASNEY